MKVKIKILKGIMLAGRMFLPGRVVIIAPSIANELIGRGAAVAVTDQTPGPAATPAPVAKPAGAPSQIAVEDATPEKAAAPEK